MTRAFKISKNVSLSTPKTLQIPQVLYLGGASGTTVSHVSDMVGPEGVVYAVEFSHRSGRDLTNMAKRRPNAAGLKALMGPPGFG